MVFRLVPLQYGRETIPNRPDCTLPQLLTGYSAMESTPITTKPLKTKFATAIENGWKKAREVYLNESGLKEDSQEWKYIMETQHFSQIEEVLNETWAQYNNSTNRDSSETAQFVTPCVKSTGLKARLNKLVGRKESGQILRKPESSGVTPQQSDVDLRIQLEQKLSGKHSNLGKVVDVGQQIADKVQATTGSEILKTLVDTVLNFSNNLQSLVGISELVSFCYYTCLTLKWGPYATLALGCIRFFFKV